MHNVEDDLIAPLDLSSYCSNKYIEKAAKLTHLFASVLKSPKYKVDFDKIMNILNITEKNLLKNFLNYNLDIFDTQGNDIYQNLENRLVLHIHNLLTGSWHIDRQNAITRLLKIVKPRAMVDIGFGVPSAYVKQIVLEQIFPIHLTFGDYFNSAFVFAEVLLNLWNKDWSKYIDFKRTDMNKEEYIGDYNLYLFQDSIEHAQQPTVYLKKYVENSPSDSLFLFSLPIGPIFPRHTIAWINDGEAISWLKNAGLEIDHTELVYVNLEVDLFAEQLGKSFHNLIILCHKGTTCLQ